MRSEAQKRWYQENRDKCLAQMKSRREGNQEKVKAEKAAYYRANRATVDARTAAYYHAHPEKRKVIGEKYYKANRDQHGKRSRKSALKKYGLTPFLFNSMADAQGWTCYLCGDVLEEKKTGQGRTLHVDHIHGTDYIRDLLCGECNTGLGKFKDSPELLRKAALYLERHAAFHRMRESWPNLSA